MDKRRQVCVYPFDAQFSPILRHKELLTNLNIVSLISLPGWGLSGKNAGIADGGCDLDYIVSSDFNEQLKKCDSVLFVDSINPMEFKSNIYPKINAAIDLKKNIICSIPLEEEYIEKIMERCIQNNVFFEYLHKDIDFKPNFEENLYHCLNINIPIIFVAGLSERTNKFHTQLSLRTNLIKLGYKVSMIGSRNCCEMLGFHSFPEFILKSGLTESNKIIFFNHCIKQIEINEKPDVIIIGIPGGGGFDTRNDFITNDFGILFSEIAAAVKPDAVVVSLHYNNYDESYFNQLSTIFKYKFGINIDYYNIANIKFDYINSESLKSPEYITLHSNFVDKFINKFKTKNINLFNIFNINESFETACYLVNKLSQNNKKYEIL